MQKILVTGAGGFIGSHLTEFLLNKGYHVKAFVRYNSKSGCGWLDSFSSHTNLQVVSGDIRDYDSVFNALKDCDTVFHLAALIGIPYSYVSPLAYLKTNIEGTYNILEAARFLHTETVVITSTSETYGTAQYVPIDENHPLVGQSPYSASKIGADQLAISYHRSFGLPVKIVRPFNTYGPRQSTRAVIPTVISQILQGETHIKLGNLHPTRDFTFVKDTVAGFYEIALSSACFGKVVNVGMQEEISIKDTALLIGEIIGKQITLEQEEARYRPQNSEVERLFCHNGLLKNLTAWQPTYTLTTGLQETINWLRKNLSLYKRGYLV